MFGEYHVGELEPGEHLCRQGTNTGARTAALRSATALNCRHGSRQHVRYSGSGGHAHAKVLLILHNAHKHITEKKPRTRVRRGPSHTPQSTDRNMHITENKPKQEILFEDILET